VLKVNDLLLVDAGAEYNYFTGDITRTFPVTGRFTEAQAEVYTGVLDIQKKIIEGIRPGITFQSLQDQGAEMLTDLMLELGLLTGRRQDVIKTNEHKKYYPHGIGHWLGMDVHDVGAYVDSQGHHRVIEPGMVFTIEPGLYIPVGDPEAAEPYRGIGIRIEDNILVTAQGHENLTVKAVKEIADIEKLVGSI
jgi:Xaa-Pro aminopeptidase